MLKREQLLDIVLNIEPLIKTDLGLAVEINQVIKSLGCLLVASGDDECLIEGIFFSMVKIYRYELKVPDLTTSIIFEEINQKSSDKINKHAAIKNFMADLIRLNAVDFFVFIELVNAFDFSVEYIAKKISGRIALEKFKVDLDLKYPKFFGLSEDEMIKKSIAILGDYDGCFITVFYQALQLNCQDKHISH